MATKKNLGRSKAQTAMKARRRKYESPTTIAIHLQASRKAQAEGHLDRAMRHAKAALLSHDKNAVFGSGDTNRYRIIARLAEIQDAAHGPFKKNPAPAYASRIGKLNAMLEDADAKASRSAAYYGKSSTHYKKAVSKLERLSEMIQRESHRSRTPGTKQYMRRWKKNPAPSPAARSAKFHRMRAALLTQLQIARRKNDFPQEQNISRKLMKVDRMFYAPRTVKRRK